MVALALQGVIPTTSVEQRERNKATAGCLYGVPDCFKDANLYGYIHPNLPAPPNYTWKGKGGVWRLCHKGG